MIEKSNIILTGLCAHLLQQVSDFHVIFFTIILIFWRNNPLESIYSIPYIYIYGVMAQAIEPKVLPRYAVYFQRVIVWKAEHKTKS